MDYLDNFKKTIQPTIEAWLSRYFDDGYEYTYTQNEFNVFFDELYAYLMLTKKTHFIINDGIKIYRILQKR